LPASATTAPGASCYTWVDQHNTLGLGNDVLALVGMGGAARPLRLYADGMEGRIDDANAGWNGRGVRTTSGDRAPWLKEGGKGKAPIAFHFQVRPDPLAD
jgi:hypothetical protein